MAVALPDIGALLLQALDDVGVVAGAAAAALYLKNALATIDKAKSPAAAAATLAKMATQAVPYHVDAGHAEVVNLYRALAAAITAGEVAPAHASDAVAYVIAKGPAGILTVGGIKNTTLAQLFKEYQRASTPAKSAGAGSTTKTVTSPVTVSASFTLPDTVGGKLVEAAEAGIATKTVKVPGMTAVEAKAVGLAIRAAYGDALTVVAAVATKLTDDIAALENTLAGTTSTSSVASTGVTALSGTVATELAALKDDVGKLTSAQASIGQTLTSLQDQIAGITTSTEDAEIAQLQASVATLQGEVDAIDQEVPGLATLPQVQGIDGMARNALEVADAALVGVAAITAADVLPRIASLEQCCADNSAVTQPIRGGGATPSLLGGLGNLLKLGFEIAIVGTIVDTLLALVDLPATIAGTVIGAEAITATVLRAVPVVTADITWSDQIHAA